MGTNFYTHRKTCKECGHTPEGIHLGKSSAGWTFSFQYNHGVFYKNVEEMKAWLADKEITDEDGAVITHEKFWEMVERKQNEPGNKKHSIEAKIHYPEYANSEMIIDGYSFSNTAFS